MKLTLKIKSAFPTDDDVNNKLLTQLIEDATACKPRSELYLNEDYDYESWAYCIDYSRHCDVKQAISAMNDHRYIPKEEFITIEPNDFVMSLESDDINESFGHLSEKNIKYIEEQINMLDYICTDIVSEQEDLKTKVDALYGFMEKSGVLQYKQLIQALLTVLEEKNILHNKDEIYTRLFKELH